VSDTLERLMTREPAVVKRLPRETGRREERFAHLLCGEPKIPPSSPAAGSTARAGTDRIAALEQELERLRGELDMLWRLTGLEAQRPKPEDEET
jgi:hypothetical protein